MASRPRSRLTVPTNSASATTGNWAPSSCPKTANPAHIAANLDIDFTISDEDMEALLALPKIEDYGEFFGGARDRGR